MCHYSLDQRLVDSHELGISEKCWILVNGNSSFDCDIPVFIACCSDDRFLDHLKKYGFGLICNSCFVLLPRGRFCGFQQLLYVNQITLSGPPVMVFSHGIEESVIR